MVKDRKLLGVHVERGMDAAIKALAKAQGVTLAAYVRELLHQHLSDAEAQQRVNKALAEIANRYN